MKTVEEVRRLRLAMLREQFGTYVELNRMLNLSERDSTLSQIANQSFNKSTQSHKTMGSPLARDLERVARKPPGWMDTDPDIWPFPNIDPDKVRNTGALNIARLEGALLATAAQVGVEIGKQDAA